MCHLVDSLGGLRALRAMLHRLQRAMLLISAGESPDGRADSPIAPASGWGSSSFFDESCSLAASERCPPLRNNKAISKRDRYTGGIRILRCMQGNAHRRWQRYFQSQPWLKWDKTSDGAVIIIRVELQSKSRDARNMITPTIAASGVDAIETIKKTNVQVETRELELNADVCICSLVMILGVFIGLHSRDLDMIHPCWIQIPVCR